MACVYIIKNKINGLFYIGSTNNFKRRKQEHFAELKNNTHHSKLMQKDYNCFGLEAFEMSILEECEEVKQREREQYYIDLYDAVTKGYNFSDNAFYSKAGFCIMDKKGDKNPFYNKKHTEATKQKLKETWARTREKRTGFKRSEDTKEKLREQKVGSKNPNATKILQYNLDGTFLKTWDCVSDIVKFYGYTTHTNVTNCCRRNLDKTDKFCTAKGYVWKYADEVKRKRV